MFGEQPEEWLTPLDKDDHRELCLSPELDVDDIKKFQSLVGALQRDVSTGRFDIAAHVMTLGRHRVDAIASSSMQHVKKLVMQLTGAWNAIASSKCCHLSIFSFHSPPKRNKQGLFYFNNATAPCFFALWT